MGFGLLFVCGRIVSLTCLIGVAAVVCCGFDGFASLVLWFVNSVVHLSLNFTFVFRCFRCFGCSGLGNCICFVTGVGLLLRGFGVVVDCGLCVCG